MGTGTREAASSARGRPWASDDPGDKAAVCRPAVSGQGMWRGGAGRLILALAKGADASHAARRDGRVLVGLLAGSMLGWAMPEGGRDPFGLILYRERARRREIDEGSGADGSDSARGMMDNVVHTSRADPSRRRERTPH